MELSPTLRGHLDVLAPYLDDPAISELVIAGPNRLLVTRHGRPERVDVELPETRIRALADRVLRAIGAKIERGELHTGFLAPELEVRVIGGPRGPKAPLVRVLRRTQPLAAEDLASPETWARLEPLLLSKHSIVVAGPHGSPRSAVLAALATLWRPHGRTGLLEGPETFGISSDLKLEAGTLPRTMLALGPDVLLADDATPEIVAELLLAGRPFVVAVEATDAQSARLRVLALTLAGASGLSRAAADALWEAARVVLVLVDADRIVGLVLPDEVVAVPTIDRKPATVAPVSDGVETPEPSVGTAAVDDGFEEVASELMPHGQLQVAHLRAEPMAPRMVPTDSIIGAISAGATFEGSLGDLDPFAPEPGLPEPEDSSSESEAALTGQVPRPEVAPMVPPKEEEEEEEEADEEDEDELQTSARERMATVLGAPPEPGWAAQQYKKLVDSEPAALASKIEPARRPASPLVAPPPGKRIDADLADLRTAAALEAPSLDPFDDEDGEHAYTQSAQIQDMVRPTSIKEAGGWNEEEPSEVIPRVVPPDEGPFEESTPVAPLFDREPSPNEPTQGDGHLDALKPPKTPVIIRSVERRRGRPR